MCLADIQGESLAGALGDESFDNSAASSSSSAAPPESGSPRRRHASGKDKSPASHRQSLAFELAQASAPGNQGASSLAAELGFDEGPAEEDEDFYEEDEDMEEDEEREDHRGFVQSDLLQQVPAQAQAPQSSSLNATPPRSRAPKSSATSQLTSSPSTAGGARPEEVDFDALDAELAHSARAIQDDLQTMRAFLSHLTTYTSDVPSSIAPTSKVADRQLFLERLTSDIIRSMHDAAKEREIQLRELQELSRQASRVDSDWLQALSEVDPLPTLEWQVFTGPAAAAAAAAIENNNDSRSSSQQQQERRRLDEVPEESIELDMPPTPTRSSQHTPSYLAPITSSSSGGGAHSLPPSPNTPTSSTSRGSPYLHGAMTSLRGQTNDLIGSLSGINEHVQVHKASLTEAGRKLKSLKATLGNIKAESEVVDQCIGFVEGWEALHDRGQQNAQELLFAQKARADVRGAQKMLDEASRTAQRLLSDPPSEKV